MTQANAQAGGTRTPGSMPPPPGPTAQSANIPLILIAVGLGLVTVIATNWYIHKVRTQVEGDVIVVYKLNRSVEPGDKLRMRDVAPQQIPAKLQDSIKEFGCITRDDLENQIGLTFKRYANASELLTYTLFTSYGGAGANQIEIDKGYRAVTLPINSEYSSRTIAPNSTVDIFAVLSIPGRRTQNVVVKERVRVLGVGNRMLGAEGKSRGGSSMSSLTIHVTNEEASALVTIGRYAVDEEFVAIERNPTDGDITIDTGSINPEVLKMLGIKMESN